MSLGRIVFSRSPRSERGLLSGWNRNLVNDLSCNGPRQPTTRVMSRCYKLHTCSTSKSVVSPLLRSNICGTPSSYQSAAPSLRSFSEGPSSSEEDDWGAEYEALTAQRNKNIIMNPAGQGKNILPGGYVLKKDPKKGGYRKVILEHSLGYFWAIKELATTNKKPILSNNAVIPAAEAEEFPFLGDLVNLKGEAASIPDFFTRNNRSKDASAKCTLVAISYKDFGAQLLPSWIDPFDMAFRKGVNNEADRYEVVRIIINEGRMVKLLSPFITSGTKKNVPESDHANTLLYYGIDAEEFRDILRMHNIYSGYIFLVDGIGRVRWAGSGEGTEEEIHSMIGIAKDLTKRLQKQLPQSQNPRIGKRAIKRITSRGQS
eukprot:scaffold10804_cov129-Skeletonema_marinoi.AAC.2